MMATKNYVAELNEYAQRNRLKLKYEYLGSDGPDHNKVFSQKAIIDGKDYPKGVGKTKKDAKLKAAENALRCLLDGKCQDLTENAAEASTPAETDINFICWLNEYGQRNRLTIKPMETTRPGPNNAIPWCSFMVGDKEYPAVSGKTAREAKEEAAKLVYDIINGNKTTDTAHENHSDGSGQQSEDLSENVFDLCTTTKNLTVNSKDPSLVETNYIGLVNDYCQRENCSYKFVDEKICGTPDKRQFFYKLRINNKQYPVGKGKSIKEAKQSAARQAWFVLQEQSSKEDAKDRNVGNGQNEMPTVSRFTSEFEPLEHLGKGAFGSVYKVRHKQLKIEYAVKVGCYKEKSLREVRTLSDLFHRNIVRYYTFWMQDTGYEWDLRDSCDSYASSHHEGNSESKFLYIQMELCAKNTLRDWIDEKNKESVQDSKRREESLRIAQEIVCGVEYIHSKNHIHRDLKPANIMFGVEGEVKIGDFGLVTSDDDDEERTVCKGTPSYMAPEQKTERKYDRKVDMFALGLIFFELLWKLSTGSERAKIWPGVRRQRFPEEFSVTFAKEKQIINSLLSEKPEDRPDASAVKAELEEWTQIFSTHKASRQENQTV
ncbi:interferon-induced, double-stranded RNA-activated protein kinase-like isoform X1 [Simochromis diagramma]|uniref:interferon-induced, double-stranded RNA-activated protein kinase-like isoform X1 n=1 Tax=Simochromis diagramma TaxID=43689 RepID=UPI001A7E8F86|nr:interferon-induced, double-stranded RNA-activated protein kinase-like isoform X1 [Simochromis diagramma]